ncbi:MAG TPA: potassium channel protein [Armatimonadota bacterium]|nr:potassium channel protein [Armatimonadota bacterium]
MLAVRERQRTSLRALQLAVAALAALVVIAVLYYWRFEHYNPVDAMFMTVITISTVGYREVHSLSTAGKLFTILFILGGLATATFALRYGADLVVSAQLVDFWGRRRRMKTIGKLTDHHIICGYGRMGQEIVRQLARHGADLVVVEHNPEQLSRLQDEGVLFVAGNATEDDMLLAAGVERAKSLVAVASSDEDNLFITISARALSPNLYIVARCASATSHGKFTRAGADRVISPYVTGGRQMAAALLHPVLVDFLDLWLRVDETDLDLAEVMVTTEASFAGTPLGEARIREQCGAGVIAVRGPDGRFHTNPSPERVLEAGDVLIALGTPEQLNCLERLARGEPQAS